MKFFQSVSYYVLIKFVSANYYPAVIGKRCLQNVRIDPWLPENNLITIIIDWSFHTMYVEVVWWFSWMDCVVIWFVFIIWLLIFLVWLFVFLVWLFVILIWWFIFLDWYNIFFTWRFFCFASVFVAVVYRVSRADDAGFQVLSAGGSSTPWRRDRLLVCGCSNHFIAIFAGSLESRFWVRNFSTVITDSHSADSVRLRQLYTVSTDYNKKNIYFWFNI